MYLYLSETSSEMQTKEYELENTVSQNTNSLAESLRELKNKMKALLLIYFTFLKEF